ncbi:3-hydroxyisobutyrate dehydrogenase [Emericellopsis atlantica]|uniref:3-hydroxyisobutyrate dehydrogenase n=1 Tax=Emericellopsis atlantica TaxID=2614577 RepID=A0A9P7ZEZ0_9HYPO|nr:3-hydroxyisobutyrate dehydrogenase [Emericellopsis atlantica]KAG9250325.1 3-hydroxyisobutyrate dehydrogenase [Emericellopsis atlantica]
MAHNVEVVGLGTDAKIKLVHRHLIGVHTAAAAEAIGLATKAGLAPRDVFDIIKNAAGSSWSFKDRVPQMLNEDWAPRSSLDAAVDNMGTVIAAARGIQFPLPVASVVEQLYIAGAAQGYGSEDDAALVKLFLQDGHVTSKIEQTAHDGAQLTPVTTPVEIAKVGFIGLGAMGQGMAASLARGGFDVHGYDVWKPSIDKFVSTNAKATAAESPAMAAKDADILLLMVQNAAQAEDVLFGSGKAAAALPDGAVVILASTVPPSFARKLKGMLGDLGRNIGMLDCPVSGGVVRAANGTLMIICSGDEPMVEKAHSAILSMTGTPTNLCRVKGGVGAASSVKMINQLLAGVHIAAAAEAMALAARLGLDTREVFDLACKGPAWSWMLENRGPQMLEADWTPHSALAIFVKDLGIVLDEAKNLGYFAPISSASHNLYLAGASKGWAKESDAGVVRLWDVSVSANASPKASKPQKETETVPIKPLPAKKTLAALPEEYSTDVLDDNRRYVDSGGAPVLVVLDDDPTGTQTCHDIDVLTVWDIETTRAQFERESRGFFILTNSRALPSTEAKALILEICQNIKEAAKQAGKTFEIVLRGDSTLRGHLPEEPLAAEEALGKFDGWILAPFFMQGGRYTIDDVHYVQEGETLVPASQTPFAQDATFGYKNSNLREYILEKCGSRFDSSSFLSVTLEDIRTGGPDGVKAKLLSRPIGQGTAVVIVNAVAESDMHVFVAGLLKAQEAGRRYLYRTAAAFVSSRLGIRGIAPLSIDAVSPPASVTGSSSAPPAGGLILAGSYVPKTTAQLKRLREQRGSKLAVVELDVSDLIKSEESASQTIAAATATANAEVASGHDILVMTSRTLVKTSDALGSLQIGSKVAIALVQILQGIETRPRYIIAKGGITSSDAASKGLNMRRARILGQAAPGVPLWRCDEATSRHAGVPYVVFPGNVGTDDTLADIVEAWDV